MRPEPGEQVLFFGHPCWRAMLGFHLKGLVLAVAAGVIAGIATDSSAHHVQAGWVALAVLAVFGAVLGAGALRRAATTYLVSDRRLGIAHGVLSRDVQETRLERVQNVACHQTLRERLLRVGSVHFDTAAGMDYDFYFLGVSHPRDLARAVDRALRSGERLGSGV